MEKISEEQLDCIIKLNKLLPDSDPYATSQARVAVELKERRENDKKHKSISDVYAERMRQIEKEGFTQAHDEKFSNNELARAAALYAIPAYLRDKIQYEYEDELWPVNFVPKLSPDNRRRELVKAAALLIAEIDRLDDFRINNLKGDNFSG